MIDSSISNTPKRNVDVVTRIEIVKQSLHFAAAHFTIFSANERENLHGHNFQVQAVLHCDVGEEGIPFDYNIIKEAIQSICDHLDEHTLLPLNSPHLRIAQLEGVVHIEFGTESMTFLTRDVILLPIRNTTVEELSQWFVLRLLDDVKLHGLPIYEIEVKIASGSGQWGVAQAKLK